MSGYQVIPMDEKTADQVRDTLAAPDYGHPATVEQVDHHAPCRVCLRRFEGAGEGALLFTYDPFRGVETLPLPGPVYIHQDRCRPYRDTDRLPPELAGEPLTFNGYGAGRRFVAVERTGDPAAAGDAVARLFDKPEVDYLHVRSTTAGCYLFTLARS